MQAVDLVRVTYSKKMSFHIVKRWKVLWKVVVLFMFRVFYFMWSVTAFL